MSDNVSIPQRQCDDCHEWFDETIENFSQYQKEKGGKRYFRNVCRTCWNRRRRAKMATPEGKALKKAQRQRRNPDVVKAEKSRSQKRNRASANTRNKRYGQAHPLRRRVATLMYKYRDLPGQFTEQDILAQIEAQEDLCFYCGIRMLGEFEIDHYIPRTKPGSTNDPDNIVICCPSCSSSKNNYLFDEWRERRGW